MIATMSGLARPEYLATTEWLADHLGDPDICVLDARWRPDGSSPAVHRSGRIPDSVHLDWRAELVDSGEGGEGLRIAPVDRIIALAERAGISDTTSVVIYDDTQGLYAARAWWTLRTYGLEAVRVLDGGFLAWEAEGRPVTRTVGEIAQHVRPQNGPFQPKGPGQTRLTTTDVRALLGSADATLLDARAPAEYKGLEGNTLRLGHIPGAVNVPVGGMHESGSQRLRDPDAMRERLHAANVSRGRRMVTYDGSGVAAAKLAFILTLLGHEEVAVYDGGWAEWGNRLDLPVDR
jgi:thiosulfate/3-mercaptopyruvate sulfurtransferase